MRIHFTKMHGLGNDFVVIDAVSRNIMLSTKSICKIADRHFGIGCDEVLVLEKSDTADFSYRIFNSDGSEAGQCGNGIRCLAKFVVAKGLTKKRDLVFSTKTCRMQTHLEDDGQVTVLLNRPSFEPKTVPFVAEKKALRYNLEVLGYGNIDIGVVSVGNPHAVIMQNGDITENCFSVLGPIISNNEYFPEKVNVGFMNILNRHEIKLRVYERGSGETLACGSGACAAVVVGRLWELLDSTVLVRLLGGNLIIKWDGDSNKIQMTGPAEQVFDGEITLAR